MQLPVAAEEHAFPCGPGMQATKGKRVCSIPGGRSPVPGLASALARDDEVSLHQRFGHPSSKAGGEKIENLRECLLISTVQKCGKDYRNTSLINSSFVIALLFLCKPDLGCRRLCGLPTTASYTTYALPRKLKGHLQEILTRENCFTDSSINSFVLPKPRTPRYSYVETKD